MPFLCVFSVSFFEVICEAARNTHHAQNDVAKRLETSKNILHHNLIQFGSGNCRTHAFTTMLSPLVLPILQHYVLPRDFSKLVPRRHESRPELTESVPSIAMESVEKTG